MDTIDLRHKKTMQALTTLERATKNFKLLEKTRPSCISPTIDADEMRIMSRDSMIQRFEYCTELFWKYLQKYLEAYVQAPNIIGPAPVIRASFAAGLLNEAEAEKALEMVKDRNMTSHIYKEEIAELLAQKIPDHCNLMVTVVNRLKPNKSQH